MTANTSATRKAKGKRLEHHVASLIRQKGLDDSAKRMPGSGAFEGFKTDIYTKLPFSFELKNHEKIKLWEFWSQAKGQQKPLKPAVLVIGGNRRPVLAAMEIDTFLELLLEMKQLREQLGI